MHTIFEANVKAILAINPILGANLISIKSLNKYEVFTDESDNANVNIIDKDSFTPLYLTKPLDEIFIKINEYKKYSRYPYLYFFGIGNGILFKLLLSNEGLNKIVIIEKEIELIYIAFHVNDFSELINTNKLEIFLSDDFGFNEASKLVNKKEARLYLKTYFLEQSLPYYNAYSDDIIRVNKIFTQAIEHSIYALGNDANDSLLGLQHHIQNLDIMIKTPSFYDFINKSKNTDLAVIVSTGPSLNKQLKLLKSIQDYVTIFCIDASFPILSNYGIKPDIVISLERIYPTSKFFKDTPSESFKDVIFALTSIQHKSLIQSIKGGVMQMSMRPFGYTRYFGIDSWGYAGIGMSAANMAYELVYHSKFERVVLIGQDLAYSSDGTSHSKGHLYGINDVVEKESDILVEAYGGGEIKSTKIWTLFKNFFEADIADSKDKMQCINATEGGARINGSKEMSFESVVEKYVNKTKVKELIKLTPPTSDEISKNQEIVKFKIKQMLKYAKQKETEVTSLFLKVAKECKIIESNNADVKKLNTKRVTKLIAKIDKIKDNFNDLLFMQIFNDSMQAWIVTQELELARIQVRDIADEGERKLKLQDWLIAHKFWLFSVAGSIQATREAIYFGLDDESLGYEFIDELLEFYDGSRVDYEISKLRVKLKDTLYPNENKIFNESLEYLISKILENKDYKSKLLEVLKSVDILRDREDNNSQVVKLREKLTKSLNQLQMQILNSTLDKNKKSILIYIEDDVIDIGNKRVVNAWMRQNLNILASQIDTKQYNLIIAVKQMLLSDESVYGVIDNIPNIIKKYKPFIFQFVEEEIFDQFEYILLYETTISFMKNMNNLLYVDDTNLNMLHL